MSLNNPYSGANLLAEWQATSTPWLTASQVQSTGLIGYEFRTVAKHFRLQNLDGTNQLFVGFTQNGVTKTNYMPIAPSGSLDLNAKFSQIWIKGASGQPFSLFVGLTGIPQANFGVLTGSNGFNVG